MKMNRIRLTTVFRELVSVCSDSSWTLGIFMNSLAAPFLPQPPTSQNQALTKKVIENPEQVLQRFAPATKSSLLYSYMLFRRHTLVETLFPLNDCLSCPTLATLKCDSVLRQEFEDEEDSFEERCRKFLAMWSFITSRVLADLTLRSAPSFGKIFAIISTINTSSNN